MIKVNGFDICHNPTLRKSHGDEGSDKEWLVYHPIYDGLYFLHGADTLQEAEKWCNKQDLDKWTERLL